MAPFWNSGDQLRDLIERDRLRQAVRRISLHADKENPDRVFVHLGNLEPFPAPLIRSTKGWRFDTDAGALELDRRRIRRNEAAAVELCHRFLEAQMDYYSRVGAFSLKIHSSAGSEDGLYWASNGFGGESHLGPRLAEAAFDETQKGEALPFLGYFFKVLSVPVFGRPEGNKPVQEIAIAAWPAQYQLSGKTTFVIDQRGAVYQRDLGVDTGRVMTGLKVFDANSGWAILTGTTTDDSN